MQFHSECSISLYVAERDAARSSGTIHKIFDSEVDKASEGVEDKRPVTDVDLVCERATAVKSRLGSKVHVLL